jgi:hypothetical protein
MTIRSKRRLLVLTALLAISSGFWWVTRPVIDLRLVGTWKTKSGLTVQYRSDGTGTINEVVGGQPRQIDSFHWRATDGLLTKYFCNRQSMIDARLDRFAELVVSCFKRRRDPNEAKSHFSFVSENEVIVTDEWTRKPQSFVRIAD